jgi:hypothetical protein
VGLCGSSNGPLVCRRQAHHLTCFFLLPRLVCFFTLFVVRCQVCDRWHILVLQGAAWADLDKLCRCVGVLPVSSVWDVVAAVAGPDSDSPTPIGHNRCHLDVLCYGAGQHGDPAHTRSAHGVRHPTPSDELNAVFRLWVRPERAALMTAPLQSHAPPVWTTVLLGHAATIPNAVSRVRIERHVARLTHVAHDGACVPGAGVTELVMWIHLQQLHQHRIDDTTECRAFVTDAVADAFRDVLLVALDNMGIPLPAALTWLTSCASLYRTWFDQDPAWTSTALWQAVWAGHLPVPLCPPPDSHASLIGADKTKLVLDEWHLKASIWRRALGSVHLLVRMGHVVVTTPHHTRVTPL